MALPLRELRELSLQGSDVPGHRLHLLWYDWFCDESSLPARTRRIVPKVLYLANILHLSDDLEVVLKNNCPLEGKTYDSALIRLSFTDEKVYLVPSSGHEAVMGQAELEVELSSRPDITGVKTFPSWREMRAWLPALDNVATARRELAAVLPRTPKKAPRRRL